LSLPFQTVETVNESAQQRQRALDLFGSGGDSEWRNRLIWGDKKYVLPAILPDSAGLIDLIYIDPPSIQAPISPFRRMWEMRISPKNRALSSRRPIVILGGEAWTRTYSGSTRR
jgi:hypothetical protein